MLFRFPNLWHNFTNCKRDGRDGGTIEMDVDCRHVVSNPNTAQDEEINDASVLFF